MTRFSLLSSTSATYFPFAKSVETSSEYCLFLDNFSSFNFATNYKASANFAPKFMVIFVVFFFGDLCLLFSIHIRASDAFEKALFHSSAEVYWRLKRDKFHG